MTVTHQKMLKMHNLAEEDDELVPASPQRIDHQRSIIDLAHGIHLESTWAQAAQFEQELERRRSLLHTPVQAANPPAQQARVINPPAQPQLEEKDRKEKIKADRKNLKKGRKLTVAATEYTVCILDAEKKRQKEQQKNPVLFDSPDVRLFDRVEALSFNPYEFTPDYLGEHFVEVQRKYEDLKRLVDACQDTHSPVWTALTRDQQIRMEYYRHLCREMETAFSSALEANGLVEGQHGIEVHHDVGVLNAAWVRNDTDVERLKAVMLNQEAEERALGEQQLAKIFEPLPLTTDQAEVQDKYREEVNDKITCRSEESYQTYLSAVACQEKIEKSENIPPDNLVEKIVRDLTPLIEDVDHVAAQIEAGSENLQQFAWRSPRLAELTREKRKELQIRYDVLAHRKEMLMNALWHFAEGIPLRESTMVLLESQYGYVAPAMEETRTSLREQTNLYTRITFDRRHAHQQAVARKFKPEEYKLYLASKLNRMEMLMKPGDEGYNDRICDLSEDIRILDELGVQKKQDTDEYRNLMDSVGRETAEITTPLFQEVMDMDIQKLVEASDEEFIAMQEELIQANLHIMMLTDLGKRPVSSTDPTSIKERFLGKPAPLPPDASEDARKAYQEAMDRFNLQSDIFRYRCSILQGAMMKARVATIAKAASMGEVKLADIMTPQELDQEQGKLKGETETAKCLDFARKREAIAENLITSARARMMRLPLFKEAMKSPQIRRDDIPHPKTVANLERLRQSVLSRSAHTDTPIPETIRVMIDERITVDGELSKAKYTPGLDPNVARELSDRSDELNDEIQYLRILSVVSFGPLQLIGTDRDLMPGPLFESFDAFEQTEGARVMEDEEFRQRLHDLSSIVYVDNVSEEGAEELASTQKFALSRYYDAISVNYNRMEDIFGAHRTPDVILLTEHRADLDQLGANTRVDCALVDHDKEMLSRENPKHQRLIHQVYYYHRLCGLRDLIRSRAQEAEAQHRELELGQLETEIREYMSEVERHREYLAENPRT